MGSAFAGRTGSSDYSEVTFASGHIGIYVSGTAQKQTPPKVGEWLDEQSG
ncbi:MAG: hypothetical protein RPT95_00300 [Candidatus Sedimenticola sp. (ex Thyasira tokunagai)]